MQLTRFKLSHLFALSLLVTTLCSAPAQAMELTFKLPTQQPSSRQQSNSHNPEKSYPRQTIHASPLPYSQPLPIPTNASQPPIKQIPQTHHPNTLSARVLPPPPAGSRPTSQVFPPAVEQSTQYPPNPLVADVELSFTPTKIPVATTIATVTKPLQLAIPNWIYKGGSDSLVARVIGNAEGTRTASGIPTRAYYGHTDPGNGVWNMGTFSYQHGAQSPQEADQKQLRRLQSQGYQISQQAQQASLTITLNEILNGLDLANQSPRAALESGGYIDRLTEAKRRGMENTDAIVWARTHAYLEPQTQRWNAPGLGNTKSSIERDQHRRHNAISQAFDQYQTQRGLVAEWPKTSPIEPLSITKELNPTTGKITVFPSNSTAKTITAVEFNMATLTPPTDRPLIASSSPDSTAIAIPTESPLQSAAAASAPSHSYSTNKSPESITAPKTGL